MLVSSRAEDHQCFQAVFDIRDWGLVHAFGTRDVVASTTAIPPVVIVEEALADGAWKDLRESFPTPPRDIVLTSERRTRAQANAAWAVLGKPFDHRDAVLAITLAWAAWRLENSSGWKLEWERDAAAQPAPSYRPQLGRRATQRYAKKAVAGASLTGAGFRQRHVNY